MTQPFLGLIGNFIDIDDLASEFRHKDYNWFLMKNVNILKSPMSSDQEKISALQHVGNLAYIGTKEKSVQVVACVVPLMLHWLKQWKDIHPSLQKPLLQSLCMLAHRSRLAQEMVYDDPSLMIVMSKMIANTNEVSTSRWLCYFLLQLISDSGKLLTTCSENADLKSALIKAASVSWDGWHDNVNVARKLLHILASQ